MLKVLLVLVFSFLSMSFSINPNRIKFSPFYVYSDYLIKKDNITLKGALYENGEIYKNAKKVTISFDQYKEIKIMSKSVLKVSNNMGNGSAIHIGDNLVLTNLHVLSSDLNEKIKYCYSYFKTKVFTKKDINFKCKKIHYCSKRLDFCLVELENHEDGYSFNDIKAPIIDPLFNYLNAAEDIELIAIGNTGGYGIHASSGYGVGPYRPFSLRFYAGIFKGNSGGGLFTVDGALVGLVHRESKVQFGTKAFNSAITLRSIKKELERNISKSILSKINWD